jgi:hypothetical protein
LLQVVRTLRSAGRLPRRLDGGQQQRHQDADDGDYDQEFHQRETPLTPVLDHMIPLSGE